MAYTLCGAFVKVDRMHQHVVDLLMHDDGQTAQHYDLITVGGGSGGLGAAGIARTFGLRTLLIEAKARNIGGDCLNYGCVPSKALIHVSRLAHAARQAARFGLSVSGEASFAKALRHVHEAQARIREHENAEWLAAQEHQDVVIGWAKFVDAHTLEVDGRRYTADKIVLATGSRPRMLDVPGVEALTSLHTNHTFFEQERPLPQRLLIVGGGAIACELGQAMQRLGSQVTLVNRGERLLERELKEYSARLQQVLEAEGIVCYHETEILRFEGERVAFTSTSSQRLRSRQVDPAAKTRQGERRIEFDEVLVAIGRDAAPLNMNLEAAGIRTDQHGVMLVDEYYRTTNPRVWVVGDAMGREKLSHGAEKHNRDLIYNFLSPIKRAHDLAQFSWVTFTSPEVATFGLSAKQLTERGVAFETIEQPFTDDDRAIAEGYADQAHLTLYVKPQRFGGAKLLGGTMIAPHAGELIQELVLAVQEGLSLNALFNKIYAYPVATRINQKAAFTYRQGGLSAWLKGVIRWWWRR